MAFQRSNSSPWQAVLIFLMCLPHAMSAVVYPEHHCWDQASCLDAIDKFESNLSSSTRPALRSLMDRLRNIPLQMGPATPSMVQERKRFRAGAGVPPSTSDYCPNKGPFEFIPIHVGTIFLNSTITLNFQGKSIGYEPCYTQMHVEFWPHAPDGSAGNDRWGYLHFTRPKPRTLTCGDWYGIGTKYSRRSLEVSVAHSVIMP